MKPEYWDELEADLGWQPKKGEPPMLSAAKKFIAENPELCSHAVVFPLFSDTEKDERGKLPYSAKHPGLGVGWQNLQLSIPDEHPGWSDATGWGLSLLSVPDLIIVDVDKAENLPARVQNLLDTDPGMNYRTRKGRHHWYINPAGNKQHTSYDWGEVFQNTARYIAGPGGADKPSPDNLTISRPLPTGLLSPPTPPSDRTTDNWDPQTIWGSWVKGTPILQGERDNTIASVAGWLRRNNPAMTLQQIQTTLMKEVAPHCQPPLSTADIKRIAESTYRYKHEDPPPDTPELEPISDITFRLGDLTLNARQEILAVLPDRNITIGIAGDRHLTHKQLNALIGGETTQAQWREAVQCFNNANRIDPPPTVKLQTRQQRNEYLASLPDPYIIAPAAGGKLVIGAADEITLIYGPTGGGKTWAALWIAKLLELPTIYLATEGPAQVARRMNLLDIDNNILLHSTPTWQNIQNLTEEQTQAELVILDILSPMLEDENTAASWNNLIRYLQPLTAGKSLLVVHHTGKDTSAGARGSSAIQSAVSYDYNLTSKKDYETDELTIDIKHQLKDRGGHHPKGITLTLQPEPFGLWATSPQKQQTDETNKEQLKEAWDLAAAYTAPYLPGENIIGEKLHQLGYATSQSAGRRQVVKAVKQNLLLARPGAARGKKQGYTLADIHEE